ncbi:MAG TPA: hypothetical protein VF643_11615, partial [Sphingomonas sp.]
MTDTSPRKLLIVEDDQMPQRQLRWAYDDYEVIVADMAAMHRRSTISRPTALLKSFGCRQAPESLGGPNPRATSGDLWGFRVWTCSGVGRHGGYGRES